MSHSLFYNSMNMLFLKVSQNIFAVGAALSCCLFSPVTSAWGAMGHEIAGSLAASYLSENAESQIKALLGDESLASAATWADRMRSHPSEFWQTEAGPYHYATVPQGKRYEDVGAPPQGDAFTALRKFGSDLRNPELSLERRQLALRFAIHIVQDLQQPFHVGNGRDRGGNQISVLINGDRSNLHRVWDRQIFEARQRDREEWKNYFRGSGLLRPVNEIDAAPLVWIAESAALRESLYPPPAIIDAAYIARELPRAEERLALAGIRTAAWLNNIFDGRTHGLPASEPTEPENSTPLSPLNPVQPAQKSWWRRFLDEAFG
ncbi:S1/P1 nuclease [Congregibacter brevis]|uniref:S1/P1 nuclease n=1 Tax=Congregibacter brevis TaxID=3081201 RepID=A0ABZ0I814_9GAMM|nr:S1/P1 nuclease [Congregibacter sp. IMCC45268]